uniref:Uncharacterized protein n=1 Tax=Vitis vinifera TaxID=29760 RepID=F6H473_VITVI
MTTTSRARIMQLKEDLTLIQQGSHTVFEFHHAIKATTSTPTAVATPCPTSFSPSPVPPVCMVPSDDISVTPIALDATTTLTLSPTPGMASSSSTSNPSFFEPPLPITPAPPTCTHPMVTRA